MNSSPRTSCFPVCDNCGHRHGAPGAPPICPPRNSSHPDAKLPPRDSSGQPIPRPFYLGEASPVGTPGTATTKGNNCLIHTLAQLVHGDPDAPEKRIGHDTYCQGVRRRLVQFHQCRPSDILDFQDWRQPIIAALDCDPSRYTVTCFPQDDPTGARAGSGPVEIQVPNRGKYHFAPLAPALAQVPDISPQSAPRPAMVGNIYPPASPA